MLRHVAGIVFVAVCGWAAAEAGAIDNGHIIAEAGQIDRRRATLQDTELLRTIDSLSGSPDGRRYAIRARWADAARNEYHTAWFVGDMRGGELTRLGDGGQAHP